MFASSTPGCCFNKELRGTPRSVMRKSSIKLWGRQFWMMIPLLPATPLIKSCSFVCLNLSLTPTLSGYRQKKCTRLVPYTHAHTHTQSHVDTAQQILRGVRPERAGSSYTTSSFSQQLIKTCIDPDGWGVTKARTTVRGASALHSGGPVYMGACEL